MKHIEVNKINGKNCLVRTNEFVSARFNLPTDAHRVLSVAISMIRQKDEQFHIYRIYTRQLIEFFPALKSDKNAIARIDTATDALMGSYIKIKKKSGWLKRNLIHSCQFYKNDGHAYVDIRLDDDMLPFLIGITGGFSAPKIENIRYFKKENHFKLYTFFYSYLYRGNTGEIPLSEIRALLSIKKSQYRLVGHLKNRLLEPSISLINRVTDINVSCMSYKHGRRIAGFIFDIKKGSPKVLVKSSYNSSKTNKNIIPTEIPIENQSLEKKYKELGITDSEFQLLLKNLGADYLEQLHRYVMVKKKQQAIKSQKAYLYGVLKKSPNIDELLTPACILKKQNALIAIRHSQEQAIEKRKNIALQKEYKAMNKSVDNYLAELSAKELANLQSEFNQSIQAGGLKYGKETVDFTHRLVASTFKRYIYSKYVNT